jgi:hypothetical protein
MHAVKKGIVYRPRTDAYSLIYNIMPQSEYAALPKQ